MKKKTILAIFAKVKLGEVLTLGDKLVLKAFNRYSSSLSDLDTLKSYLSGLSEQLMEFSSNVKGILHEIQFAAIENNNFDNVYASLCTKTTNHPGYDIRMFDDTGEEWDVQLKASDNSAYVEDWST